MLAVTLPHAHAVHPPCPRRRSLALWAKRDQCNEPVDYKEQNEAVHPLFHRLIGMRSVLRAFHRGGACQLDEAE
jgi:hypothetical protein